MEYNKINKDTYNKIAKDWDKKRRNSWDSVNNFLKSFKNKDKLKLLDVGCGTGRHLKTAVKNGFKKENIVGLDCSSSQLKIVEKKGFNTIKSDMQNIDLEKNSFDVIIVIASIHHLIKKDDQLKSLKEIKRILKKDGKVLISFWKPSSNYVRKNVDKGKFKFIDGRVARVTYTHNDKIFPRYYYFFGINEFSKLVKKIGFKIEDDFQEGSNYYFTLKND